MTKFTILQVQGISIDILQIHQENYISLTDMLRAKDGDFFISDWLRNRNTIEFLGIWEEVNNPNFNYGEFAIIRSNAGLNSYKISVKEWTEKTHAIGLIAKTGRYGSTYAHKDIAFEFGMWISPKFKIYLIKEFQRLKEQEQKQMSFEWNVSRTLAKINYKIHTEAIKNVLIPGELSDEEKGMIYASEADILNKVLFGQTASERKKTYPNMSGNIRDYATIEQLVVLSNLESINALLIEKGFMQSERIHELSRTAISQMTVLLQNNSLKKLGKSE